jgi:hypothetical protein
VFRQVRLYSQQIRKTYVAKSQFCEYYAVKLHGCVLNVVFVECEGGGILSGGKTPSKTLSCKKNKSLSTLTAYVVNQYIQTDDPSSHISCAITMEEVQQGRTGFNFSTFGKQFDEPTTLWPINEWLVYFYREYI